MWIYIYIYIYIKFIIIFYTIRVRGRGFFLIVKLSKDIWGCEAVHSDLEPILLIKYFFLSLIISYPPYLFPFGRRMCPL